MEIMVTKRNGSKEKFDFDKIYNHLKSANEGLNVDIDKVISNLKIHLVDGIQSKDIQKKLILVSSDLIDEDEDFQYLSGRLYTEDLYRTVYPTKYPKFDLRDLKNRISKGFYSDDILQNYTDDELSYFLSKINFENDKNFTFLGISQMRKKYLLKFKNEVIETPQEIFMLIPIYIFQNIKDKKMRKKLINEMYISLSNFDIFLPTPDMAGIRTNLKGFTSCAGINLGDSIESIANGSKSMFHLITELRAGIGNNPGFIRGEGGDIRNGMEKHTGIIPYIKVMESISKSSTQPSNGRSGSVTNYYPFFHWEIENILELKNNKGAEEFKARHSDHTIVFDDLIYERAKKDENITLFHLNEVPGLYESIGTKDFKKLYEKYEKTVDNKNKKQISALNLLNKYYYERYTTSRIYKVNANNFKNNSSFKLKNITSNLCLEIGLPSIPDEDFVLRGDKEKLEKFFNESFEKGYWEFLQMYLFSGYIDEEGKKYIDELNSYLDENGEEYKINFGLIFSCILGGINFGKLPRNVEKRRQYFYKNLNLLIRFLDEKIDYQDYKHLKYFEKFSKEYRALGISPGNLFYYLAKNNLELGKRETLEKINEIMEEFKYYALKVSNELAKEKGKCRRFNDTKYSDLELVNYNKNVDELVSMELFLDWETLKNNIKEFGLRNSTLLTAVPSSNSSRPGNMISGINPPKEIIYLVEDNSVKIKGILPKNKKYNEFYKKHLAFEIDVIEYWKLIAVIQKWIDQSISLNEYVDYTKFEDNKIPIEEIVKRDTFSVKYGLKTLYYVISKSKKFEKDEILSDEENSENEENSEKFTINDEESNCASGGCFL